MTARFKIFVKESLSFIILRSVYILVKKTGFDLIEKSHGN